MSWASLERRAARKTWAEKRRVESAWAGSCMIVTRRPASREKGRMESSVSWMQGHSMTHQQWSAMTWQRQIPEPRWHLGQQIGTRLPAGGKLTPINARTRGSYQDDLEGNVYCSNKRFISKISLDNEQNKIIHQGKPLPGFWWHSSMGKYSSGGALWWRGLESQPEWAAQERCYNNAANHWMQGRIVVCTQWPSALQHKPPAELRRPSWKKQWSISCR